MQLKQTIVLFSLYLTEKETPNKAFVNRSENHLLIVAEFPSNSSDIRIIQSTAWISSHQHFFALIFLSSILSSLHNRQNYLTFYNIPKNCPKAKFVERSFNFNTERKEVNFRK